MRRHLFIFVVFIMLISLVFSNSYGKARYLFEKTWLFTQKEEDEIGAISFSDFYFLANTTYQKVIIIEASPGLVFSQNEDGIIIASYNGTMYGKTGEVKASAYVDVFYDPKILVDQSFVIKQLSSTPLTTPTQEMITKAKSLSDQNSILGTIRNLTDFVYHYVTYNSTYCGKILPAAQVYNEKNGVCVEYSHLFIALARSIGLDAKYVYGDIVEANTTFDNHAWVAVDIPEYGLVFIDPTYLQVGRLDNSHIVETIGSDNNFYKGLYYSYGNVTANFSIDIKMLWSKDLNSTPITGNCSYDDKSKIVFVNAKNNASEYTFFPYYLAIAENYGPNEYMLGLLPPGGEQTFAHQLNKSAFKANYYFTIPTLTRVYDYELCEGFVIYTETVPNTTITYVTYTYNASKDLDQQEGSNYDDVTQYCLPSLIFLLPLVIIAFSKNNLTQNG